MVAELHFNFSLISQEIKNKPPNEKDLRIPFIISYRFTAIAQTDSINQRIFLLEMQVKCPVPTHPIIAWLKKNADWNDDKNTVIYLGDNIYPLGMPLKGDPTYSEAKRVLDDQISLVKGKKAGPFLFLETTIGKMESSAAGSR